MVIAAKGFNYEAVWGDRLLAFIAGVAEGVEVFIQQFHSC